MLDLIENAQLAIDDLIDVMGRATIEAVLRSSGKSRLNDLGRSTTLFMSIPSRNCNQIRLSSAIESAERANAHEMQALSVIPRRLTAMPPSGLLPSRGFVV